MSLYNSIQDFCPGGIFHPEMTVNTCTLFDLAPFHWHIEYVVAARACTEVRALTAPTPTTASVPMVTPERTASTASARVTHRRV